MQRGGVLSLLISGILCIIAPIYVSAKIELEIYYSLILVILTFSSYYYIAKGLFNYYFKPSDKKVFEGNPFKQLLGCQYNLALKGRLGNYDLIKEIINEGEEEGSKYGEYVGLYNLTHENIKHLIESNRDKNFGELILYHKISSILYLCSTYGYSIKTYDNILDKHAYSIDYITKEIKSEDYDSLYMLSQYQLLLYKVLEELEYDIVKEMGGKSGDKR